MKYRVWRTSVVLALACSSTACAISMYKRTDRSFEIDGRVLHEEVRLEKEIPAVLRVEASLNGTRLTGRLKRTAVCRQMTERTIERLFRKETVYLDGSGQVQDLRTVAGTEIGLGLAMPLVGPVVYAIGQADNEERDPDALSETSVRATVIASAVIGGLVLLDGIVTAVASGTTGSETEMAETPRKEIIKGPPVDCHPEPLHGDVLTYLKIGTTSATVALSTEGAFNVDLERLADPIKKDPMQPWSMVRSDGTSAMIHIPDMDRFRLAGRLE